GAAGRPSWEGAGRRRQEDGGIVQGAGGEGRVGGGLRPSAPCLVVIRAPEAACPAGLPQHQFVLARRVERAKLLLQGELSLAAVAACAGFSAQSQFSSHFKRLVGVTPRQFRMPPPTPFRPPTP